MRIIRSYCLFNRCACWLNGHRQENLESSKQTLPPNRAMKTRYHPLISPSLGTQRELVSWHFGPTDRGRKAYIQASLHADELPGMLVAHHLRERLDKAEERGDLLGEVVLVPVANPIGLSQALMHHQIGRFELGAMENFNRHYPDFFQLIKDVVADQLGQDAGANKQIIREAMRSALLARPPATELQSQRHALMLLAFDADLVLDLHCDYEAVLHLYVEEAVLPDLIPLARYLGARALLCANGSGTLISFDEALSGPWWRLREHFQGRADVPLACASATVELRGQADVDDIFAAQDAQAIMHFLQWRGLITDTPPTLPLALCEPTPLSGTAALCALHAGVIVFHRQAGDSVRAGDHIADIVDPMNQRRTPVTSMIDGVVYARHKLRWATTGMEICRVAGSTPIRSGNLLSP